MAINVTQRSPRVTGSAGRAGSAGTGQKLGALLGAVAGGITGGPGGAVSGAGAGANLGGMVGGQIDPGRPDTRQAIQRRVEGIGQQTAQADPQETIKGAILSLRDINDPGLTRQHAPILAQALIRTTETA